MIKEVRQIILAWTGLRETKVCLWSRDSGRRSEARAIALVFSPNEPAVLYAVSSAQPRNGRKIQSGYAVNSGLTPAPYPLTRAVLFAS